VVALALMFQSLSRRLVQYPGCFFLSLPVEEVSGFNVQVSVFFVFFLTPDPPPAEHLKP
jgi:hypothetical protein